MTSGENQTQPPEGPATNNNRMDIDDAKHQVKMSARRVSQENIPQMTANNDVVDPVPERSPQYVSGCEGEDGVVVLRSDSPMRCVSEFDEIAASAKDNGDEQEQEGSDTNTKSSSALKNVPLLPNPLHSASLRSNHIAALRLEAELHPMRMILGRLMVHTSNKKGLFNSPVDASALGLVDYHQVVQTPMDLGNVKARLYSIAYHSRQDVASDISLVFENAMSYNPPSNSVHIAARVLRDYFGDLYAAVGGKTKALPRHTVTEVSGKMKPHSPPGVAAVLLSRRVSFATDSTTNHGAVPSVPNDGSTPAGIARAVSSEAGLGPAAAATTTDAATAHVISRPLTAASIDIAATTTFTLQTVSATACSAVNVNKANQAPNGLTEVPASLGTLQGTRARAGSFSSPTQFDTIPKPTRRRRLSFAGKNRTVGHSCTSCLGRRCSYCEQGCLPLEPTLLICNGGNCAGSKIRKGATFFIAQDGTRHYCQRCFTSLPPVLPQLGVEADLCYKRDLLKRKYDEELVESWLACSKCDIGVHQICAMHNSHVHSADDYLCPGCVEPIQAGVENVASKSSSTATIGNQYCSFVTGAELPVCLSDVAGDSFRLGKDILSADALAETDVSSFIEAKVRERLKESSGIPNTEKTVTVRIISDCDRSFQVPEVVRRHFRMPTREADQSCFSVSPPNKVVYRSKAIALFQKVDGLDVAIFIMYVQEYSGNDEYNAGVEEGSVLPQSKKRVYIAYLDSVEHFRPRSSRTDLYHELLVSYLASARVRGFETAHIWSCPPSRGNSFCFWNHPKSQRTPSKERLISWYHGAIARAIDCGVVTDVKSMYEHFEDQLQATEKKLPHGDDTLHPSGKMLCPPLHDGCYFLETALSIHEKSLARHRKAANNSEFAFASSCPATQIASVLADIIGRPESSPFRLPVNAAALKLKDYHKIISKPMDLGTVYTRLVHGEFLTLKSLVEMVELIWANGKKFNPPGNFVHSMALQLEVVFLKEINKVTATWGRTSGMVASWHAYSDVNMSLDTRLNGAAEVGAKEPTKATAKLGLSYSGQALDAMRPIQNLCGPDAVAERMVGGDKWMLEKKRQVPPKRPSEEEPSSKRRRQTWLGEEVSGAVRSMRSSMFSCSLAVPSLEEKETYRHYIRCHKNGVDEGVILPNMITDARHALLEFSQYRNLEFGTLRHAKFSTAMLLYHLHNHDAPGVVPICTSCKKETVDCRWHKVTKIEELRKDPINKKRPGRPLISDKSRYQAEELCTACYTQHPRKDQFIPLHVTLISS